MTNFLFFIITLFIASVGGFIAWKLHFPAGSMIGAMIAVTAFNLLTEKAFCYADIRLVIQILAGAMTGCRIGKSELLDMKKIVVPIIILILSMFVLNITAGSLIYLLTPLDIATALFAAAPGGLTDMAIISYDLGANPAYVVILQLFRILTILTVLPPVFKKFIRRTNISASSAISLEKKPKKNEKISFKRFTILLVISALGGFILNYIGVAAGAIIGAMLASTVYSVLRGKVWFPSKIKTGMQILAGAFIGMRFDKDSLTTIVDILLPLAIMIVTILIFVFGISFLICKLTTLDMCTSMLASTPGGLQEMALLSEELGGDTPKVAVMQTSRLMCVIIFFPTMLAFITGLFTES